MSEKDSLQAKADAWILQEKLKAFTGGIKAASIAMEGVLRRKVDVGIIPEATAKAIFEGVAEELTLAFKEPIEVKAGPVEEPQE